MHQSLPGMCDNAAQCGCSKYCLDEWMYLPECAVMLQQSQLEGEVNRGVCVGMSHPRTAILFYPSIFL